MSAVAYVLFTSWVECRQFMGRESLAAGDVILAHDHNAFDRVEAETRQIVFVRSSYQPTDSMAVSWRLVAGAGRSRNEENGFGATEVVEW